MVWHKKWQKLVNEWRLCYLYTIHIDSVTTKILTNRWSFSYIFYASHTSVLFPRSLEAKLLYHQKQSQFKDRNHKLDIHFTSLCFLCNVLNQERIGCWWANIHNERHWLSTFHLELQNFKAFPSATDSDLNVILLHKIWTPNRFLYFAENGSKFNQISIVNSMMMSAFVLFAQCFVNMVVQPALVLFLSSTQIGVPYKI